MRLAGRFVIGDGSNNVVPDVPCPAVLPCALTLRIEKGLCLRDGVHRRDVHGEQERSEK
jgi:hypothetical protein